MIEKCADDPSIVRTSEEDVYQIRGVSIEYTCGGGVIYSETPETEIA